MPRKKSTNFVLVSEAEKKDKSKAGVRKQNREEKQAKVEPTKSVFKDLADNFFSDVNRLAHWLLFFLFSITILFTVAIFNLSQRLENIESKLDLPKSDTEILANESSSSFKNILEITQFAGNRSVVNFGSKIEVNKNSIETIDSPNCQTSSEPATNNNCFLTFSPSLTGLPKSSTIFTGISFEGDLTGDNSIRLDLVDNLKSEIIDENFVVDSRNFNDISLLPLNIAPNYSIRMNFWQKGSNIKINKIKLYYLRLEDMVSVSGRVNGLDDSQRYTGTIYLDANQDRKLDETDTRWICSDFHPGVEQIEIEENGEFVLIRDSDCYTQDRLFPEHWSQDSGASALPIGNWIMTIFDENERGQSFYFSVETTDEPMKLDLQFVNNNSSAA